MPSSLSSQTAKRLLQVLGPEHRRQALILLILFVITAVAETVGVASVIPFVTSMSAASSATNSNASDLLPMKGEFFSSQLFIFGCLFLLSMVAANSLKAVTKWKTIAAGQYWGESIAKHLFSGYLTCPYDKFKMRNTAELTKSVLSEVHAVNTGVIIAILELISKGLIVILVAAFVVAADPTMSIVVISSLTLAYVVVGYLIAPVIRAAAAKRAYAQGLKYRAVTEAFRGMKEIKLGGYEQYFESRFSAAARDFADSTAKGAVAGELPRYVIEVFGLGVVLAVALWIAHVRGVENPLPLLALYAFAGYRMLPALQGIYQSYTKIGMYWPSFLELSSELSTMSETPEAFHGTQSVFECLPLHNIKLEDVAYRYAGASSDVLGGFSCVLKAKTVVGIKGASGSGKSTLIDVISGLLPATGGAVKIDDICLDADNRTDWMRQVACVTQQYIVFDGNIVENIAVGIDAAKVCPDRLSEALHAAALEEVVIRKNSEACGDWIGEYGSSLSGGERQRLAIARAVYAHKSVLILDEPTSALDKNLTANVIRRIRELPHINLIVVVSHDADVLDACDEIIDLEQCEKELR